MSDGAIAGLTKSEQKKLYKRIGLRNMITTKEKWSYLLFYEKDGATEADIKWLVETANSMKISYIVYSTMNGVQMVSFTPLNAKRWGECFQVMQFVLPEYYSGQTIRLSRKPTENQKLLYTNLIYPVVGNLYTIYKKRFTELPNVEWQSPNGNWLTNYSLVFEKYWSIKP